MNTTNELEVSGVIVDLSTNRLYSVRLHNGRQVSAHVDGTLRMKLVRLIPGEQVVVKLSDVDPSRGRIIRRVLSNGETRR